MQNFSSIGKRIHARKKNWPFFLTHPVICTKQNSVQCHHLRHENFEMILTPTGSWTRSRHGAIESNCPSASKSSRIFPKFSWRRWRHCPQFQLVQSISYRSKTAGLRAAFCDRKRMCNKMKRTKKSQRGGSESGRPRRRAAGRRPRGGGRHRHARADGSLVVERVLARRHVLVGHDRAASPLRSWQSCDGGRSWSALEHTKPIQDG